MPSAAALPAAASLPALSYESAVEALTALLAHRAQFEAAAESDDPEIRRIVERRLPPVDAAIREVTAILRGSSAGQPFLTTLQTGAA